MMDILHLLIPIDRQDFNDISSMEVGGHYWKLTEGKNIPAEKDDYTCISYACGMSTIQHPFDQTKTISTRTLAAMTTVIENEVPTALWVDEFCVPSREPDRSICLTKLGVIYAMASKVVIVLSEACFTVLKQIQESNQIDAKSLSILEADEWVSRVWTYQELVNNSQIHFVAEGHGKLWINVDDFFSNVSYAIHEYQKLHGYSAFDFRSSFPRVSSLEDVILDWKIADYLERSAYQVISGMHYRSCQRPDDHFLAMIGAIQTTDDVPLSSNITPAEAFMRLCEAKGDYSFIYTTAPRSEKPGYRWRPKPTENFQTILPWHSYGDGQSATVYPDHIDLDQMWMVEPAMISSETLGRLERSLLKDKAFCLKEDRIATILGLLRKAGYKGSGEFVETEFGFFFPQLTVPQTGEYVITVATSVKMTLGAPGLLLKRNRDESLTFHDVGIFVGTVPKTGEKVRIQS